ncbi:hypothetical protein DM01DRAFT_233733, partial [Hesseltinella vesiculosa]
YATSMDKRLQVPVFQYTYKGHMIMWDRETKDVHLPGLWHLFKLPKHAMAGFLKINMAMKYKRFHGGSLNIQGTWIPWMMARQLCVQMGWPVREALVPMLG